MSEQPPDDDATTETEETRDDAHGPRSVIESLRRHSAELSGVLLPDSDSEYGASPILDPVAKSTEHLPPARGNYEVLGEIARGGMGVILKGHDRDLGRDVALKVLDESLCERPAVVQRFVEEAQIGGQLQHPGIVPVYELGLLADDRPFFTMKLVKGRTLAAILEQRRSPTDERGRMLSIFESICQTVAYAHSKGVIHRDLKPANIMVGAFGEVQVVDWGLAKVLNRGGVADEERARREELTVIETVRSGPGSSGSDSLVGSVLGTPAYMSPEQAQGEVALLDGRSDVFSLGAILCEILTGKPPYDRAEGERTVARAAKAQLEPARDRVRAAEADEGLKELCLDCLMTARAARPRDAGEVAERVHDFRATVEQRAHEAELAAAAERVQVLEERRRRRLTLALAAVVVVALVSAGGGWNWIRAEREARLEQLLASIEREKADSLGLAQRGLYVEAVASAERVVELCRNEELPDAQRERARAFLTEAEQALERARGEEAQRERDAALVADLQRVNELVANAVMNRTEVIQLGPDYARAFRDYGYDLSADDLVPAMEQFRARGLGTDVTEALALWVQVELQAAKRMTPEAEGLIYLAMDLDPDPRRTELRQAILELDEAALFEMAAPEKLAKWSATSCFVIANTLYLIDERNGPRVGSIMRLAREHHPGSFLLQFASGYVANFAADKLGSLRSFGAAVALRPESLRARQRLAEQLVYTGRLVEARAYGEAEVRFAPEDPLAHSDLAYALLYLGELEACERSLEASLALEESAALRADLDVLHFHQGRISAAELREAAQASEDSSALGTYAAGLIADLAFERSDPAGALELLDAMNRKDPVFASNFFVARAMAFLELGDAEAARDELDGRYDRPGYLVLSPLAQEYLRAVVHVQVGETSLAREEYARAEARWNEMVANDYDQWQRSDVAAWRRRAQEALGR